MRNCWRFIFVLSIAQATFTRAQVQVWQGTLKLPTYEEGLPDPNPPFDQFVTSRFNYPYTLRTNLTNHRAEHEWRAVYLENEYLKCSVLPDIGGHLYTCTDKISDKPMFYANPSIKKANIGYRGAWAAFGVEFNFPVSHNWVSMSSVSFAYAKHEDGSASVTVGNTDRVYGMEWTVELILRPKSTVLEERVTLSNRSDVRHRFYWWNNAGVEVWDDSHIEYPMRFTAAHGFADVAPWPVDRGKDLSIIRNQTDGPVSRFVYGSREPFMGVWNPKTNTGTVHYAEYSELPAKKIWSWGVDADGLDWRKALSDNDSAYVEIQGGLFRNQETYAFLEPRKAIHFSEYWMPAREIGGISRANLTGVASLRRESGRLLAGLNVNQSISRASIAILDNDKAVFQQTTDLKPEKTWSHELPTAALDAHYTFELRDANGAILLRQTEGQYDWTPESEIHVGLQQAYKITDVNNRSEGDWVQLGKDQELNGELLLALDTYKQGLGRFPAGFALEKSAGRLAASLLQFAEARDFLKPVLRRDTSDAEAWYYMGLAYDGLGDEWHAREAYENARLLPSFRAAASLKLGELLARQGDLRSAERMLCEAQRAAPDDVRTFEELTVVRKTLGEDARSRVQEQRLGFPLSDFLKEEMDQPNIPHLAADANRVLNIASQYMRLGLYTKALTVLSRDYPTAPLDQSEPGVPLPQKHPLVAYFRGYCKEKLGESSAADYGSAAKLSAQYVFPSTAWELTVLRAALRADPNDGTAHYLLGTLYFSRGLTDDALEHWSAAQRLNPDIPVLNASRGLALLRIKNDPQQALAAFHDGLKSDAKNVAVYFGLDQALSILERPAQERVQELQKYPDAANMPSDLVYELTLNRAEAGDYEGANALFRNRFFPREEGGTNVRQVWIEVQLQRARELAGNNRCGDALAAANNLASPVSGLSFTQNGLEPFLKSARVQYLLGSLLSKCGRDGEASAMFRSVSQATGDGNIVWAFRAAEKLPGFKRNEWQQRLEQARTRHSSDAEAGAWSFYQLGLIEQALGNRDQADTDFKKVFLMPDRSLAYHLTRLAQAGSE